MLPALAAASYQVIRLFVRDAAIVYDELEALSVGVGDEQETGHYSLTTAAPATRWHESLAMVGKVPEMDELSPCC